MKLFVKSLGFATLLMVMLCACDYETEAYKKLRLQKDSIQALQQSQLGEMEEYLDLIQDVDSAFDEIRLSQNILTFASYDSENPSDNMRQKVADNMSMINDLLAENQMKIAELEEREAARKLEHQRREEERLRKQAEKERLEKKKLE